MSRTMSRLFAGLYAFAATVTAVSSAFAYDFTNVPAMNGFPGNVTVYSGTSWYEPTYASVRPNSTSTGTPGWWLVPLNSVESGLSVPVYATWGNDASGGTCVLNQFAGWVTLNNDGTFAGSSATSNNTGAIAEFSLGTATIPTHGTLYVQFELFRNSILDCGLLTGKASNVRYGNQ